VAVGKTFSVRWWMLVVAIVIGTLIGFYLQRFVPTAPYFRNIVSVGFNFQDFNLLVVDFGLKFYLHVNLGTLIGGIVGLWLAR
jgi:hypothetical protein